MFVDEDVRAVTPTGGVAGPTVSNEGYVAVLSTRLNF